MVSDTPDREIDADTSATRETNTHETRHHQIIAHHFVHVATYGSFDSRRLAASYSHVGERREGVKLVAECVRGSGIHYARALEGLWLEEGNRWRRGKARIVPSAWPLSELEQAVQCCLYHTPSRHRRGEPRRVFGDITRKVK